MKQSLFLCALMIVWAVGAEGATLSGKSGEHRRMDSFRRALSVGEGEIAHVYADFEKTLSEKGLTYSGDISYLAQRGSPNGRGTAWQSQYYGTANWNMFHSDMWGNGSAQIAYTAVRYWGNNAQTVNNRIGIVSAFNDYTTKANYFDQLSYTHQFPNNWNGVSLTLGQFPMYNFDGGTYDSNQQITFMNYALSQNGSSTYPSAGFGGYLTITPTQELNVSVGFQDAHNITGKNISVDRLGKGKYTTFGMVSYAPTISGLGEGAYSFMYYNQPAVPEQNITNSGWSLNLQQQISEKVVLFGRINGVNRSEDGIKQSYVLGGVCNNPFNRNKLDQIGLALAVNRLNKQANGSDSRTIENVLEGYVAFGINHYMTLTPDIQFYINPGESTDHRTATVSSLRATIMF